MSTRAIKGDTHTKDEADSGRLDNLVDSAMSTFRQLYPNQPTPRQAPQRQQEFASGTK